MIGLGLLAAVVAGGIASVIRFGISSIFAGRRLPWAVFIVNVIASFIGGLFLGLADLGLIYGGLTVVLIGGIAGGLSTFSTFSVETIQLVQENRVRAAMMSVAANLIGGVLLAALGYGVIVTAL